MRIVTVFSFEFRVVTLTQILGLVLTFTSNYCQGASFLIPEGHFTCNRKKLSFGKLASAAILFLLLAKFYAAWQENHCQTLTTSARTAHKIPLTQLKFPKENCFKLTERLFMK